MLELDILLLSFFDNHYTALSLEQQKRFVELLAFSDQELYGWLIGQNQPDAFFQTIVKEIRG